MELPTYSTQIIEGESIYLPMRWTVKDTGEPVDLTGSTISFESKRDGQDLPATITNPTQGEYTFELGSDLTLGKVSLGGQINLNYLVKHTNPSGGVDYIYRIKIKVVGDYE